MSAEVQESGGKEEKASKRKYLSGWTLHRWWT